MSFALVLSPDLMAVSSISSAARHAGWTLQTIMQPSELLEKGTADLAILILDLAAIKQPLSEIVQQARLVAPGVSVIAFGPHVQGDVLREAADAGCDLVCTRGEFMRRLSTLFSPIDG
jgi:hypothetical protein